MSRGFRIWDIEKKEYVDLVSATFSLSGELLSTTKKCGRAPVLAENYIVERDTGLKDVNGKMIREGDIVKITSCSFFEPDIGIVGFDERRGLYDTYIIENNRTYWETGSCFCSLMSREDYTTEVIGNIHENPELLEGEDEDDDDDDDDDDDEDDYMPTNAEINDLTDIGYGG